jgi:hypothetical protein
VKSKVFLSTNELALRHRRGMLMNVVSKLTIDALKEERTESLEQYAVSLCAACKAYPPPFGMAWYGQKYRKVARDPMWLAQSLIANASKEGEGSQKLWELAGRTGKHEISEQIRRHAIDEARHARQYIAMLDIAFPNAADEELRLKLYSLSPGYTVKDQPPKMPSASEPDVLDELIQMNIGEIRTRIHQLLLRPVILAHCSPTGRDKLTRVLDSLLKDETRHIEYTARLIEQAIVQGNDDFVYQTMHKRLAEFNQITLEEVGELNFEGA